MRITDWMDRLQSGSRSPSQPCPSRMEILRELRDARAGSRGADTAIDDSDDGNDDDEATEEEESEKLRSALPDAAVPIGLLANLSLDKDKDKGKGRGRRSSGSGNTAKAEDDDNVVRVRQRWRAQTVLTQTSRVLPTRNTLCQVRAAGLVWICLDLTLHQGLPTTLPSGRV